MAFMQRQITKARYWRVSANKGEQYIIPEFCAPTANDLHDYVEGTIDRDSDEMLMVEYAHGWIGRLSAPGFMDCTDWLEGASAEDVNAQLAQYEGEDDDEVDA